MRLISTSSNRLVATSAYGCNDHQKIEVEGVAQIPFDFDRNNDQHVLESLVKMVEIIEMLIIFHYRHTCHVESFK